MKNKISHIAKKMALTSFTMFLAIFMALFSPFHTYDTYAATTKYARANRSYFYTQSGQYSGSSKNGCAITSIATIISVAYGKRLKPATVAKGVYQKRWWNLKGNTPTSMPRKVFNAFRMSYRTMGKSATTMAKALAAGYLILARAHGSKPFTDGGHYIAIIAANTKGQFLLSDPGDYRYRNKWMSASQVVRAMHSSITIAAVKRK